MGLRLYHPPLFEAIYRRPPLGKDGPGETGEEECRPGEGECSEEKDHPGSVEKRQRDCQDGLSHASSRGVRGGEVPTDEDREKRRECGKEKREA